MTQFFDSNQGDLACYYEMGIAKPIDLTEVGSLACELCIQPGGVKLAFLSHRGGR